MKKNMGSVDTSLRIIATAAIGILLLTGVISGTLGTVLGVVAAVFLLTGVISFCPLYTIFKISTRKQEAAK